MGRGVAIYLEQSGKRKIVEIWKRNTGSIKVGEREIGGERERERERERDRERERERWEDVEQKKKSH